MKYFLKKLLNIAVTLFLISIFTFWIFQILPGNTADIILGVDADPLQIAALSAKLGLDRPMPERYMMWIKDMLRGDFGTSLRYQTPVSELISKRLPVTMSLTIISVIITVIVVIPFGIYLAKNNGRKRNSLISALSQLGMAIPTFWMGIILILIFSVALGVLPSGDFVPFSESFEGALESLILPALSISIGTSAVIIRYMKNNLLDQMHLDYVRTALSKGLTENKVIYRHVLKNALLPVITIFGMTIADTLGGSIIVENVFNLPGIGNLIISAVGNRDIPLVQGLVFYLALMVVIINMIVDIIYTVIDPRIRMR